MVIDITSDGYVHDAIPDVNFWGFQFDEMILLFMTVYIMISKALSQ